jgi:VWFA-related protein
MRDVRRIGVSFVAAVALSLGSTSAQAPQPPQFRAAVDLVHLDVSVLDKTRMPVRGLTAADFIVLEDGKPQAVSTFTAVDYPDVEPPSTPWMRTVESDVRRNDTLDDRRLFVIVLDDGMAQANLQAVRAGKDAAKKFIERLGPSDLAAVLFTMRNQHSQDYTSDKSKLLAAIDRYASGFRGMGRIEDGPNTDEFYLRASTEVLRRIAEALTALPQRRKTLVYIGQGIPVDPATASAPVLIGSGQAMAVGNAGMHSVLLHRTMQALAAAQRANVNIYTLDPCGLRVPPPPPTVGWQTAGPEATCVAGLEQEFLKDLAHATGGRAAIDMNDLAPAVEQIFVENASYYLIGFQSTNPRQDGKFRRLEVKVNRPDVEVRARNGYNERHAGRAEREAELEVSAPLAKAISGLLPKGDVPLQVWAASYAVPGQRNTNVAITLGVRQALGARSTAMTETVDVSIDVFTPEGKRRTGKSAKVAVTLRPGAAGDVGYEIVSSLPLAPGRYQLRIGAKLMSDASTGSIYYDLVVPDVSRDAVAISAIALTAAPGVATASAEVMPWLPVRPTTARLFARTDIVTAFARLYQQRQSSSASSGFGQAGQPRVVTLSVPARARVFDAEGREVWTVTENLDGNQLALGHVDLSLAIPISRLQPGPHMLAVEARGVTQSVRFTVR